MSQAWQRRRAVAQHTDDWLMTYADMITLLLCFFAIFLSISVPKKNAPKTLQPTPLVDQRAMDVIRGDLPFYGLPHLSKTSQEDGDESRDAAADNGAADKLVPLTFSSRAHVKIPEPPLSGGDIVADVAPEDADAPAYPSLIEVISKLQLADGLTAHIEQKGKNVTNIDMSSGAFFTVGSALLSEGGQAILRDVAENLKAKEYEGYQATVEGHTDDSPMHTNQFPSNWELSTARASAVVRFLIQSGVPRERLRAAGYADTFPIAPNRDAHGDALPENQARNRRVVIRLEKSVTP